MIWLGISILLSTILLCCTLIFTHLADRAFTNAVSCLDDLCDIINENFPGSDLKIVKYQGGVKVKGELKYYKKS